MIMPNLNHCIDCDKPMQPSGAKGLCDSCYDKEERIGGFGGDTGTDADYEPTTADEYNQEWLLRMKDGKCWNCDGEGQYYDMAGDDNCEEPLLFPCHECEGTGKIKNENM